MARWELAAADLGTKGLQGAKADIVMKVSRTPRQWKSVCTELNINKIKIILSQGALSSCRKMQ